jgi:glucokinase
VIQAALSGDLLAKELLADMGSFLGIGLASLLNIFNPQVVVLGGGLVSAGELLLGPTEATMNRLRMKLREDVPLRTAELGAFSGVVGAAMLA